MRILIILLAVLLIGCASELFGGSVVISEGDIVSNINAFLTAGCEVENIDSMNCEGSGVEELTFCEEYSVVEIDLGVPVIECIYPGGFDNFLSPDQYIRNIAVDHIAAVWYVIADDGFTFIKTKEELKSLIGEVDSHAKAYSYVMILTGSYPAFEMSDRFKENSRTKSSSVVLKDGGYNVLLYDSTGGICCGTNYEVMEITYFVSFDGEISKVSEKKVGEVENFAIA